MKYYKNIIVIICFFVFACVKVAWADSYTITFKTGSSTGSELMTTTSCETFVQDGCNYIDSWVPTRTYYTESGGLRLNTSSTSTDGKIVINLTALGQVTPTSIVVNAKYYDSGATLSVNGLAAQTLTSTFANYTYDITSPITQLILQTNKGKYRAYIKSITVNYIAGVSHTLSSAVDPAGAGSVSPSSTTLSEGGTIEVTATPIGDNVFSHWTITGTGATLSSTSANPTEVTMGTTDATVTAHFVALTPHTVTFNAGTGTCSITPSSLTETSGGAGVVLPSATPPNCDPGYSFFGWATASVSTTSVIPTIVGTVGDTYYPLENITLYAVYVTYPDDNKYVKVNSDIINWTGKCLIVYEDGNIAFNGSLETLDAISNYSAITISGGEITTASGIYFTISKVAGGYAIKSASGKYIGRTATNNGMNTDASVQYVNTISYNGTSVDVVSSGGPSLQYNTQAGQTRFRYFASTQGAIQVYMKNGTYISNPSCTCPGVLNLEASGMTHTTALLSWNRGGTESHWQVVYSAETPLVDPSSGIVHDVTSTTYNATNLITGATYYAYVRAKCAEDDFSGWTMVQFETPCIEDWAAAFLPPATDPEPGELFTLAFQGNSTGAVTWFSSNPTVVEVVGDDLRAVAEGYCVITATVAAASPYCEKTLTCNVHVASDGCARVGWGVTEGNGVYSYSSGNSYSYTQQVYTANEIRMAGGTAGKISSIKVHHGSSSVSTNSKVYIGFTTESDLEDNWISTDYTEVYSGSITFVNNGWTEINLSPQLDWDGESNIVVAFKNNTSATASKCKVHQMEWTDSHGHHYAYKARSCNSSSEIALTNMLPTISSSEQYMRNNMRFCISPCDTHVDAYFNTDVLNIRSSGTTDIHSMLTVNPAGGTVTYTSSNTSVATINSSTGVITPRAEGTTTIIAHVAATAGGNCSATAYMTVKVCGCPVNGDERYQFGNQAQAEYVYAPVDNTYKYGYRQIIYPAENLMPGTIHSIAFNYQYSNNLTEKDNIDIYMGHTKKSEFTSRTDWVPYGDVDNPDLKLVYHGPLYCSQGWNRFDLQTPFAYNGCDNLVVAIDDNSGKYNSENGGNRDYYKFYTSNSTKNVMIYYHNNTNNPNPANLKETTYPYNTVPADLYYNHYPDTRFCITPGSVVGDEYILRYDISSNCTGAGATITPASIPNDTAVMTIVTSVVPHCSKYSGFKEWNTDAGGNGTAYHAGDYIKLCDGDVTLYAIYNDVVQGESSCENAVAFCGSGNSMSYHVEPSIGESYGNFCAFFQSPGTWWYMQVDQPGDIFMNISSTAGDVDMACWGPFDNKTCDLADLTDNGANGWKGYMGRARAHSSGYPESATAQDYVSTPICETFTLDRPSGNLVDYGGSISSEEYLQIIGAQRGEYYMILVANYANSDGDIVFELDPNSTGSASCDIVNNCDITSISATTACTSANSYTVSGDIYFRDAPTDGTLTISDGIVSDSFAPPFSSPVHYTLEGLSPNGLSHTLNATFSSTTINCSKLSTYTAPAKNYCEETILPVELLSLHASCNGKRALVTWTTASERNNDYFVVERSDDAVNFVEVGRVAGAGNSIEMLSYNYADYSIRTGDNYYRLTQVDYDGTRTTSEIIEVHCSGNVPLGDPDVYVYPNPFGDELTVHLVNFGDVAAHIQVYDMLGRMLFERTADDTEVVLQLGALPDAAYTVRVSTADFVVNKKVVKNN